MRPSSPSFRAAPIGLPALPRSHAHPLATKPHGGNSFVSHLTHLFAATVARANHLCVGLYSVEKRDLLPNPTTRPENRSLAQKTAPLSSGLHRSLFPPPFSSPPRSAFIHFFAGTDLSLARDTNLSTWVRSALRRHPHNKNTCPQEQQLDALWRSRCQHVSPPSRGPDRSGPASGGPAVIRQQYSITG